MKSENMNAAGNSNDGQLLRDIEEISKALYLHKTTPKALTYPSAKGRSVSTGKTHFSESKSNSEPRIPDKNELSNEKKSSTWNWKKPLRALAHLGHHRFNIYFFLHVHSIERLPSSFSGTNLCVHWKRKDEVSKTRPSRVFEGTAEFEETLMHKCCVYGSKSGPHHSAKYDVKLFWIYASIVGAPGLDIGKHLVDLTRLLPLTLEELEGEKSSGKWTTSFKLTGKAKDATLTVSFDFSLVRDNFVESNGSMNVWKPMDLTQNQSGSVEKGTGNSGAMLHRITSVPSNSNCRSTILSQYAKGYPELLPNLGLELSRSVSFLYQKLSEGNSHGASEFDILSDHEEPVKFSSDRISDSFKEICRNECDSTEFIVIEKGIEISRREELESEEVSIKVVHGSEIETINVDEIIKDVDIAPDEELTCMLEVHEEEVVIDHYPLEECNVIFSKGSTTEGLESAFNGLLTSESASAELEYPLAVDEFVEQQNHMEVKLNYKTGKMSKKSLSLDDIAESVASDFLNMLQIEHDPVGMDAHSDPESPRERLLRDFEKEVLASGNFILDFETREEQTSTSLNGSDLEDLHDDFDFHSSVQAAGQDHKRAKQLLIDRRKAKVLEDLETKALMHEWGMNEKAFQSSPRIYSDGFGSPILFLPEEPVKLPPLGDGLGPFLQTKDGGFLQSMNPSLFQDSRNVGSLIMQVSNTIVLPAEMGCDVIEILQHLAVAGIENICMQVNSLMPLEDITGKTMQQVAQDAGTRMMMPERQTMCQHELFYGIESLNGRKDGNFQSGCTYDSLSSSLTNKWVSGYVLLQDLVPSAMEKIESLLIEGLRIQSGMPSEEAPSTISPLYTGKSPAFGNSCGICCDGGSSGSQQLNVKDSGSRVDGFMSLAITLDEWLRLDAGLVNDVDQNNERKIEVLAVHHAKCIDLASGSFKGEINCCDAPSRKYGLLGNNLTLAFMVLLRDPLRNYEPVGTSMLALIQVERTYMKDVSDKRSEEEKNEEDTPCFKITEVHLSGLRTEPKKMLLWSSKTQQQSGTSWLLASGMSKSINHPFSKSKAITRSYTQGARRKVHSEDVFWSITSHDRDREANWRENRESTAFCLAPYSPISLSIYPARFSNRPFFACKLQNNST